MIKLVLVGIGSAFKIHVETINHIDGVEVGAVIHPDILRAKKAAENIGCKLAFASVEESFPYCDAVVLCSPPGVHREAAVNSMEAGKAVLVEKPIASVIEDAKAMIETSSRTGVPLMMGFNFCFRDGFIFLHDKIADGSLGKLNSIYMHRQSRGQSVRNGVKNWRVNTPLAVGHTIDSLCHDISVLRYLAGDVKSVQAYTLATLEFPGYDNTAVVSMKMESGALASIYSDWNSSLSFNMRGVSGSKGAISLSGPGNWDIYDAKLRVEGMDCDEIKIINDIHSNSKCYQREYEVFINAVKKSADVPAPLTGIDGLKVLEISHAILNSSKNGKEVSLS